MFALTLTWLPEQPDAIHWGFTENIMEAIFEIVSMYGNICKLYH